jgi:mono/diheme cytochrome c family protein
VDISLTLPSGDVERGAALAQSRDCLNCHRNLPVAPPFEDGDEPAIGVRAGERIKQTDYTGSATTVQGYLLESIVDPDAFVVDGYDPGLMPHDFGDRLTRQQAADLIVYLSSLQ